MLYFVNMVLGLLISILFLFIISSGKEFKAVFISTVRTLHSINPKQVENLGFLSDKRLLNTAMTRAQSLVAVVGEPLTLCLFGECSRIWEQYLFACNEMKGLFGISYKKLGEQMQSNKGNLTKLHRLISETKVKTREEDVYLWEEDDSIIQEENMGTQCETRHGKPVLRPEKNTNPLTGVDLITTDDMKVIKPPEGQLKENQAITKPQSSNVDKQDVEGIGDFSELWNVPVEPIQPLDDQIKQKVVSQEMIEPIHYNVAQQNSETTRHVSNQLINDSLLQNRKTQGQIKPKPYLEDFASQLGTSIPSSTEKNGLISSDLNAQVTAAVIPSKTRLRAELKETSYVTKAEHNDIMSNSLYADPSQQFSSALNLAKSENYSGYLSVDQLILNRDEVNELIFKNPMKFVKCKINSFGSPSYCSVYGEPCEDIESGWIEIVSVTQPVFNNDIALIQVMEHTPGATVFKRIGNALGIIQPAILLHERVFLCWFDKESNVFVSTTDAPLTFFCPSNDFDDETLDSKLFVLKLVNWDSQKDIFTGIITTVLDKAVDFTSSLELWKRIYDIDSKIPPSVAAKCQALFPTPYTFPKEVLIGRQRVDNALSILLPGRLSSDHGFTVTKTPFGNYRIGIHVIDMPCIIEEGTALDLHARTKCQTKSYASSVSVMPPISLLPPELERDAACLLVDHERPTISVFVTITQNADISVEPLICKSVTVVSDQLLADEISVVLAESTEQYPKELVSKISLLARVTQRLKSKRQENGSEGSVVVSQLESGMQKVKEGKQDFAALIDRELSYIADSMVSQLLRMRCPSETPILKGSCVKASCLSYNLDSHLSTSPEDDAHLLLSGSVNALHKAIQNRNFEAVQGICCTYFDLVDTAKELKMRFISHFPQYVVGMQSKAKVDEIATCTSPSQKYADILIQRLLHQYFLDSTGDDQSRDNRDSITEICDQLSCTLANIELFKEKVRRTKIANNILFNEHNQAYLGIATTVGIDLFNLAIFTNGVDIFRYEQQHIKFADMGLSQDPFMNTTGDAVSLVWDVCFIVPNSKSNSFELSKMVVPVSNNNLFELCKSSASGDADKLVGCWKSISDELHRGVNKIDSNKSSGSHDTVRNCVVTAELAAGKILPVWVTSQTDINTGIPIFEVELLQVKDDFRLCLQHRRRPEIFLKDLHNFKIARDEKKVSNIEEYRKVWEEINNIDSAMKAIEQNSVSFISNVKISFIKSQELLILDLASFVGKLSDSVNVGDYVCLRVPYFAVTSDTQAEVQVESEPGSLDRREFNSIWIGHGIVSNVDDHTPTKIVYVKINSNIPQLFKQCKEPVFGECEIIRQAPLQRYIDC